jgi:Ni,Fe-hydrogenase III large subunit
VGRDVELMSYVLHLEPPAAGLPAVTHLKIDADGNRAAAVQFEVEDLGHREEDAVSGASVYRALDMIAAQGGEEPIARTLAFALAVERQRLNPTTHAQHVRLIAAELERARRHVAIIAAILETVGAGNWRERVAATSQLLDAAQLAAFPPADAPLIIIGGVRRDLAQPDALLDNIVRTEGRLRRLLERLIRDRALLTRLVGVGLLTREDAINFGAVGPFARASEVALDTRYSAPYAAYAPADGNEEFRVKPITQSGGDVFARLVVMLLEAIGGLLLARQATQELSVSDGGLTPLPNQPLRLTASDVVSRTEAPGGELLCYLRLDDDGQVASLRWRTPAQANMPLIPQLLTGQELADVPLIMLSAYL